MSADSLILFFKFRPRLVDTLKGYRINDLRDDAMAGLTVGIVALPLAMAFAIASGVSPQAGIFTAIIAGFLISALGGTNACIGGPTGAFIVILFGIVSKYGFANLMICTFMAGVMLVLMGLLRMGQIIKYFPMPLVIGFTNGIAVMIFLTQMKDFFGLPVAAPSGFFPTVEMLKNHLASFDPATLGLAAASLALILFWPKRLNKFLPSPFVALILATLAATIMPWDVATIGSKFGGIPQGLPEFRPLTFDLEHFSYLLTPAFTIALLGAIESLLCAVAADQMTGTKHNSNQELIAQGIANMVVPFFGGIPATGAIARTGTNIQNGGKTPVAGIVHAVLLLAVILVAAPLAQYIPLAVLAAILIAVSLKMGDWNWREFRLYPKRDLIVMAVTFGLTVVFDLTVAVQIGLLLAAVFFIQRMAGASGIHRLRPENAQAYARHSIAGKDLPEECAAFRVEGALFFGAADRLDLLVEDCGDARVVILQLHRMVLLDATGMMALGALNDRLAAHGKALILCGAGGDAARMVHHARETLHLHPENVQPDLEHSLRRARELLAA
ncbi:sodium-independent anion transporter [Laribacter hongkongensis]|uniref:SulP family inorganic anion transporter n=1 Tax=Laribacter hongkongensis TaxID=168471 RepID=UPI001EFD9DB2|nr:SulP family inorganic anion transporter [Laribacter hongkongensis]MCG8997297.1 sodium-independent anion transporter [Laribacter hongkongensis]MCG9003244.1 sodium-independent anion transporter [Laribacter hongkongensis]MCG9013359.1 sodium-independent anion transporter [Laribacter hongkongensis]MCG9018869.1 sodium-independent anion transporter [Laribacter hongkongensis]MCG9027511.1 sodium-independent anion transporter [Laribacter hongkongensis]